MVELGVVSAGTTDLERYGYPSGYEKPPVEEMVRSAARVWGISGSSKSNALETAKRLSDEGDKLEKSEGLFVFPYFEVFGSYQQALDKLLRKLSRRRGAHSFFRTITTMKLRRNGSVNRRLEKIAQRQESDLLVIPAQLGARYAGMSLVEAIEEFDRGREIPLGIFEVGSLLLVCDRLSSMADLFLDCPADEIVVSRKKVRITTTPCFSVDQHGKMVIGHHSPRSASPHYGAVTGFRPRTVHKTR